MDYLAYSHMAVANQEGTGSTQLNLPKFKFNWKKHFKSACLAIAGVGVLFSATVSQAHAANSVSGYTRTNGNCLRVRSAPSINAPVVGCLANGSRLAIVVDTPNGFSRLSSGNYVATKWIGNRPGKGTTNSNLGVGGPVILGLGSQGRAVAQAQRALGTVSSTGFYGYTTERAVRDFQASNGLIVDGKIGPQTRLALGL
ncbi:MAG: peptidoglycan-binding protein [Tolypothrix sp. Co-bin9]|nr:peptidoglycan-binding protein [Tolypothrix sp. Co-bin9]